MVDMKLIAAAKNRELRCDYCGDNKRTVFVEIRQKAVSRSDGHDANYAIHCCDCKPIDFLVQTTDKIGNQGKRLLHTGFRMYGPQASKAGRWANRK